MTRRAVFGLLACLPFGKRLIARATAPPYRELGGKRYTAFFVRDEPWTPSDSLPIVWGDFSPLPPPPYWRVHDMDDLLNPRTLLIERNERWELVTATSAAE